MPLNSSTCARGAALKQFKGPGRRHPGRTRQLWRHRGKWSPLFGRQFSSVRFNHRFHHLWQKLAKGYSRIQEVTQIQSKESVSSLSASQRIIPTSTWRNSGSLRASAYPTLWKRTKTFSRSCMTTSKIPSSIIWLRIQEAYSCFSVVSSIHCQATQGQIVFTVVTERARSLWDSLDSPCPSLQVRWCRPVSQ